MGVKPITLKKRNLFGDGAALSRLIALIVLIVLATACAPSQSSTIDSGVEGQITIGPMCPVIQIDQPCPDQPYQATLTVLNQAGKKIAQIQSDVNGLYRIALPPGNYNMQPEPGDGMTHAQDLPFTVLKDQFTKLDIVYDSGIR
jgi:hypothetical protein